MKINKKVFFIAIISILTVTLIFTFSCDIISTAIEDAEKEAGDEYFESFEYYEEISVEEFTGEEIGAQEPSGEIGGKEGSEEAEESPVEFTGEILVKLDEIENNYSLEFRQYLESLEINYLESLLNDDSEIKKEYDLFKWINAFSKNNILFTANENTFPDEWYESPIDAIAESLPEEEIERSKNLVIAALHKYPIDILKNNLKNVYVLKSINFFAVDYGGTNSADAVYLTNSGVATSYADAYIEEAFHHEFSSILFRNYEFLFNEQQWRNINPEGFEYFDESTGGSGAIKEGKDSKEFNAELHKSGFLYQYARSTLENDFNSFAENIFMGNDDFFTVSEKYEKIEMKLDLIVSFYNSINPRFTIDYFKGL
ncbi:MAG: hypothetical protein U9O59_04160 [Actinomycetota bacterium]|nr:hypothetical protein [Actinomycetota bacterium]